VIKLLQAGRTAVAQKEWTMNRLFEAYRALHEQAFVPIFCRDEFDSRRQVEACVQAGCKGIEYTLRKADAREMIPWVRKNYPDLFLIVGSTIDCDKILTQQRRKFPQLMTLDEISQFGVDGFISMLGWSEKSIAKWSPTHLVIPTAWTTREALIQTAAGAQFQKLGGDVEAIKRFRGEAAFEYCPIFVSGGQVPAVMDKTFAAGAVVVGTGFDVMLQGRDKNISAKDIEKEVRTYVAAAQSARRAAWPQLAKADGGPKDAWLAALPHYHPFGA
jgi:2-keto-3-deoxy-6-phosphogluconate aldolase